MSGVDALAGLAIACGAAAAGGPLSEGERRLAARAERPAPRVAARVRLAIGAGEDPLGEALLQLQSRDRRRARGAFYTGVDLVEGMIAWVLDRGPQRLIDPGCGSGRFALAAARKQPSLEIVALDVNPLATLVTRAGLATVRARRATVLHADFLRADLGRIAGRTAFVGNPPYVRHHALSAEVKAAATALATAAARRVSGLSGLHALFYLATCVRHAADGDAGCFVTSSEWLDTGYGAIVRDLLAGPLGAESLLRFDPRAHPFENVMTTAVVSTFQCGTRQERVWLDTVTGARGAVSIGHGTLTVTRAALRDSRRWTPLFEPRRPEPRSTTIGAYFRVSRGQVTGNNAFFVMARGQARARGIERFCVPLVTRAAEIYACAGVLRDNTGRLVGLAVPPGIDVERDEALAAYVRGGEAAGVHRGYVASRRTPWFAVAFPSPPIVATYMARRPPAFARNPDGLGVLNIAHGLYPRTPLDDRDLDGIVGELNAEAANFAGGGRRYHGGLEKFEPREMEALPFAASADYK